MTESVLSIITVCCNAKDALRATMDNVLAQTWRQFEHLIIDGNSFDGTNELLEEYKALFSEDGISFRYISEPDQGIYDAMNKGARLAGGHWLLFLNAGDLLADTHVLEKIFKVPSGAQIIYGDTLCTYQSNKKLYPALPLDHLNYEMAFCHQSAFVTRELLLKHPYDTSYKVCADHHFFLSMYLQGKTFEYRRMPVSIYEISGYSDENQMLSHKEQHRMQKEMGIFHLSPAWIKREMVFYLKQSIKQLFGSKLTDRVRRSYLR